MAISRMPVRIAPVSTWQKIKDLLKKYKVVSRGLAGLSHVLPDYATPLTGLSGVANSMGFGRRRLARKRRVVRKRKVGVKRPRVVRKRKVRHIRPRK